MGVSLWLAWWKMLQNEKKKKKEEDEEEEDDDLIRFHLVCVSVEFYSCGMG